MVKYRALFDKLFFIMPHARDKGNYFQRRFEQYQARIQGWGIGAILSR